MMYDEMPDDALEKIVNYAIHNSYRILILEGL